MRKQKSGSAKMYELGKKPSLLWYTPEDFALVKAAAKADRRPMTQFAIVATLAAARKVMAEHKSQAT